MLSVVVCTANRPEKLRRCLGALVDACDGTPSVAELVVVDNSPGDATRLVVDDVARRCSLTVRYVAEGRRGLSYARNTGVTHAAFPLIAFTDDDCVPARDWMASIVAEFTANESLALLGGRVEPLDASDGGLGIRLVAQRTRIVSYRLVNECLIGCNFAIRRTAFDAVGPFDVRLGRGTSIDSGEDRDYFYRTLKRGLEIVCSPRALVYHGHGRQHPSEVQHCQDTYATGRGAFYCKHIMAGDRIILKRALSELAHLAVATLRTSPGRTSSPFRVLRRLVRGALYLVVMGAGEPVRARRARAHPGGVSRPGELSS
jgi:glycosyltransferase involved in cell wall biosynthesis